MDSTVGQSQPASFKPGMPDRRQRKPDALAVAFRWLSLLVYPILVVCVFIFVAITSAQQRSAMAQQINHAAAEGPSAGVGLKTLLPLLLVGLAIGIGGMVLSKFRARRRSDYNYQTQLFLTLLSAGGLVVYFLFR